MKKGNIEKRTKKGLVNWSTGQLVNWSTGQLVNWSKIKLSEMNSQICNEK